MIYKKGPYLAPNISRLIASHKFLFIFIIKNYEDFCLKLLKFRGNFMDHVEENLKKNCLGYFIFYEGEFVRVWGNKIAN